MTQWVRICSLAEAPQDGKVIETEAAGISICLANLKGELAALDNLCPHRQGPLGQGWIEGEAVICPWHSWAFNLKTGLADFPVHERVEVFPVKIDGDHVLIEMDSDQGGQTDLAVEGPGGIKPETSGG